MRDQILQLLRAIDETLEGYAKPGERLDLYLLGRASLILRFDLTAVSTADVDIVQMCTSSNGEDLEQRAMELFGRGTDNARRLGLYLERVPQGLPPLPHHFKKRCVEIAGGEWQVIRPKLLEIHDFAVTKLKRFAAKDREDLKLLCDRGEITPEGLEESVRSAMAFAADPEEDPIVQRTLDAYWKVRTYLETGEPSF
jgi:hypothetical protein